MGNKTSEARSCYRATRIHMKTGAFEVFFGVMDGGKFRETEPSCAYKTQASAVKAARKWTN